MPLSGTARGDAAYNAVTASNPNFSQLSTAEKATLKSYFETLFSADTTYLTGNTQVNPSTLNNPSGQPVATTGTATAQTGTTTAPQVIAGLGTIS